MGEAKRRRQAARSSAPSPSAPAGWRPGGRPSEILDHRLAAVAAGRLLPEQSVPCNGCTACCHQRIDIDPTFEPVDEMKRHLDVTSDERGLCLRRRDDGGCVHLGPEGCTVHQYRPLACRVYDCRIYALGTGGQPVSVSPGHKSPAWQFEIRSERDAEIRDAYLLGAAPWMGRSEDLDTALRRIMMDFQHHVAIARALYDKIDRQRLSPAEKQQLYRAELRRLFRLAKRRSLTMADVGC